MDRPLAAFDIESIPDPDAGRRLWGLEGDDAAVIDGMLARRLEDTDGRTDFLPPPHHRIVTIAVAWLDPSSGSFKLGVPAGEADEEASQIEAFFSTVERPRTAPRLISWNGNGFDLPVLRYRAMLHGIAAPGFYRTDGEWKWNNYQNRFHDLHVDLMDVLAGFGASERVGLDALSRIMGLPGKTVTEGHRVAGHVLRGEMDVVRTYCELDALNTLLLYLLWCHHRGRLDRGGLRRHVGAIAAVLREDGAHPAWREYAGALEGWPEWLARIDAGR